VNLLVTNSEGNRLERPASSRTFNVGIVLKNLVGEGAIWIRMVRGKDWRTVVNTETHFRIL
jgi:hypothetical protein